MEQFQGRSVAMDLIGRLPDAVRATAQVTTLESWAPTDGDFVAGTGMVPIAEKPVELSPQAAGLHALTTVPPMFPRGAMGTSGTMIFHVVLGRDGRIHSLHVVSTPDASVAISYAQAMRQWKYKPFVLNGVPAEVDTVMRMNYSFSQAAY
jgi:outer membrane biosynthesis protein TonB